MPAHLPTSSSPPKWSTGYKTQAQYMSENVDDIERINHVKILTRKLLSDLTLAN